ncbi:hypothetical protein U1Q18_027410, partial [Sarracenia purpurea var. burkii]
TAALERITIRAPLKGFSPDPVGKTCPETSITEIRHGDVGFISIFNWKANKSSENDTKNKRLFKIPKSETPQMGRRGQRADRVGIKKKTGGMNQTSP